MATVLNNIQDDVDRFVPVVQELTAKIVLLTTVLDNLTIALDAYQSKVDEVLAHLRHMTDINN